MTTIAVTPTEQETNSQAAYTARANDRANINSANSVAALRQVVARLLDRATALEDKLAQLEAQK